MKIKFFSIALCSLIFFKVQAATYIFTGAYNTDWCNSLNWRTPAGMPGNTNLKANTILIESRCTIPQGITLNNYGRLLVKSTCPRFDFYSLNNFGRVEFEYDNFYQALGSTFTNYANGILILPNYAIHNFCHIVNKGTVLEPNSFTKISIDEFHGQ